MQTVIAAYVLVLVESTTFGSARIQTIMRFDNRENCEYAARQIGIWAPRGLICLPGAMPR